MIRTRTHFDIAEAREDTSARRTSRGCRFGVTPFFVVDLTLLATVLCLLFLASKSIDLDEATSLYYAQMPWSTFWRSLPNDANMTFYYLLLRQWINLVGVSDFAVRTLSIVPAVGTVALIYALGSRLFGPGVGATSAVFLTLNAFWLRFAQQARSYSLVVFLVSLSVLLYVECIERPSRKNWIYYTSVSILAVYSHAFASLVLVAQWISTFFSRPRRVPWRGLVMSVSVTCIASLPLAYCLVFRDIGNVFWIRMPSLRQLFYDLAALTGYIPYLELSRVQTWAARIQRFGYVVLGLVALVKIIQMHTQASPGRSSTSWRYDLLLAWFSVPLILTILISLFGKPILVNYYLIIIVPALALLAALGLSQIRPTWLLTGGFALMVFALSQSVVVYYRNFPTEDFRGATAYVLTHARPRDAIIFYAPYTWIPYRHYQQIRGRGMDPAVIYPTIPYSFAPQSATGLSRIAGKYARIWLLLSHDQINGNTAGAMIQRELSGTGHLLESRQFYGIELQLYGR
jgi:mannosyltransferase